MSMDVLLKADIQPFVSTPVSFRDFLLCAKNTQQEDTKYAPKPCEKTNFTESTGLSPSDADEMLSIIDVCDIRNTIFNREMDSGLERNRITSQGILQDENSRRRNAQYKSIAHRALRYDHLDQKSLARKSPYLQKEDETLESSTTVLAVPAVPVAPVTKPIKKSVRRRGKRTQKVENVNLKPPNECPEMIALYNDLLINVSIYFGYTRELEYHEVRLGRLMKVTDRLELTGAHTLLDLKNAFSCPADFAFLEDFSEKKPTVQDYAKNRFPTTMFFIHDTFYIEPQDRPLWEDPSANIRKWAAKQANVGEMHVALMSEKRLGDLTCRLGQPYVYIHQGGCEHLIAFNDLGIRDETHSNVEFPRRLVERNFRRIACDICKEASAQWMLVDHEMLLPNSPGYLCGTCYKEFCFTTSGEKVCPFKAVPYCDRKEVGDGGKFISELRFEAEQD